MRQAAVLGRSGARAWELRRLRHRLLHQSGRVACHARRTILRLAKDLLWASQLATALSACKRRRSPAHLDNHQAAPAGFSLPTNDATTATRHPSVRLHPAESDETLTRNRVAPGRAGQPVNQAHTPLPQARRFEHYCKIEH